MTDKIEFKKDENDCNVWHLSTDDGLYIGTINCLIGGAFAKLFAVAPELLAALEAVLPTLDDATQDALTRSNHDGDRWADVARAFKGDADKARAAIAKAKGDA